MGIEYAELLHDGKPVAKDEHRGEAGARHLNNEYSLPLQAHKSGTYTIRASVRSEGGLDSNGHVYLNVVD